MTAVFRLHLKSLPWCCFFGLILVQGVGCNGRQSDQPATEEVQDDSQVTDSAPDTVGEEDPPFTDTPPGDAPDQTDQMDSSGPGIALEPDRFEESAQLFPLGVASAEATESSILLWTRYVGRADIEVILFRLDTAGLLAFAARLTSLVANSEGIVQVDVDSLVPATRYRYFFVERWNDQTGARSRLGEFRTAPSAEVLTPVTFSASGDSKGSMAPYPILGQLAEEEVDFFIHLGDTAICDPAETLEEYRRKYREVWADPYHIQARASTGFYAIWDDHELANDWAGEDYVGTEQFDAAFQAFTQYNPIRLDPDHPTRLWRAYRWGRTLDLIILDCRAERAGEQYISSEQMEWLKERLSDDSTVFKIIVNSVPVGNFTSIKAGDRWQGYDAQRDEILRFIHDHELRNIYWISSDFHAVIVADLTDGDWCEQPEDGRCPFVGHEFVVGPIAQTLFSVWLAAEFLPWVEFVRACDYTYHVFTVEPTTDPPELRVRVMAEEGDPSCVLPVGEENVLYQGTYTWRDR